MSLLTFMTQICVHAQEIVEEAKLQFELPNEHWRFIERKDHGHALVYTYKRDFILDSVGRKIDSQISFLIESVDSTADVVLYSIYKRSKTPFEVVSMFSHEDGTMKFKYGVGYQGKYFDSGLQHRIYVVYGIYNTMGITMVMDTTEEIAEIVGPEFLKTLKTFDTIE